MSFPDNWLAHTVSIFVAAIGGSLVGKHTPIAGGAVAPTSGAGDLGAERNAVTLLPWQLGVLVAFVAVLSAVVATATITGLRSSGGQGQPIAQWLVGLGITAVVLHYRVVSDGHYWPAQLEDWDALATVLRSSASEWGVDVERVGVIGFSAGAHLAALASLRGTSSMAVHPALQVLVYPAIDTQSPYTVGEDGEPPGENWRGDKGFPPTATSAYHLVHPGAPPAFMVGVVADDNTPVAENTDVYDKALQACGVPCKYILHDDPNEGHGCNMKDWWTEPCEEWLQAHDFAHTR